MIDETDLEALSSLISNGFTLQESMNLTESKNNRECFRNIRNMLEKGINPSEFFSLYVPAAYRFYIQRFLKILPFSESLALAIEMIKEDRKLKNEYKKGLFYPCMLFTVTVAGIILFNELCFPPLLSMMKGFHQDNTYLYSVRIYLRTACLFITAAAAACISLLIFFRRKNHQVKGYQLLHSIFPDSVVTQYVSRQFVVFFRQCIRRNISTRQTMQILKDSKEKPVISMIAEEIDNSLRNGMSFSDALDTPLLDSSLCRLLKIAVYSSDMDNMLDGYLEIAQKQAEIKCRRITAAAQVLSYISIGLILIIVYQLLMLPLQIISAL